MAIRHVAGCTFQPVLLSEDEKQSPRVCVCINEDGRKTRCLLLIKE